MGNAARAGIAYFGIAFVAGFLLGTLRVLFLAPTLGDSLAVLIELPIMLAISWIAAGWLIARFKVHATPQARGLMGAVGFALLMIAEYLLGWLGFGRPLTDQFSAMATLPGALGLSGQIAFGLMPLFVSAVRT